MKKHIPTIAALLMMFVCGYVCPTWSTVTPVGLKVLGAFIGWLILVIAGKGMVIASCLAFFAFALSGYQTPAELLAAGFGSTGLLQFLYAFLLTGAFTRSGAGEVIVRWALSRKAFNIFYNAPVLIVIYAKPEGPVPEADSCLAAQNLMLAAHNEGLGTCWIGFSRDFLNTSELKAELGIPDEYVAAAPLVLGYAAIDHPAVPRKDPEIYYF